MQGSAKVLFVFVVAVIGVVTAYFMLVPEGGAPPPLVSADAGLGGSDRGAKTPDPGEIRNPLLGGMGLTPTGDQGSSTGAAEPPNPPRKADLASSRLLDEGFEAPAAATDEGQKRAGSDQPVRDRWDLPPVSAESDRPAVVISDGGKDDAPSILVSPGGAFQPEKRERAESVSAVPGGEPAVPAAPRPNQPDSIETWTIAEGDTLVAIAETWFGSASKWELIAEANPGVDPGRLQINTVLRMPPKSATLADLSSRLTPTAPPVSLHTVRSGESLSAIARKHYGSSRYWKLIYDANRTVIEGGPDSLEVGMKLTLPVKPKE